MPEAMEEHAAPEDMAPNTPLKQLIIAETMAVMKAKPTKNQLARLGIQKHQLWCMNNHGHISWAEGGGEAELGYNETEMADYFKRGNVWEPDCARAVNWCMRHVDGIKAPKGSWLLNSTGLTNALPHLSHAYDMSIGDIVTFGYDGDQHAASVYKKTADPNNPVLYTHGYKYSPNDYSLLTEIQAHTGPVYYLSILPCLPNPKAAEEPLHWFER
jgi:hypothetical protein